MSSKRHILRYGEINETMHRNLTKVILIITAETILFKDKEFRNGLNGVLRRNSLFYELVESHSNKLKYSVKIDYDRFNILTDYSNNIMRDITVILESKGLTCGESYVKHHTIWIKLP
jgi:hypothetical protein